MFGVLGAKGSGFRIQLVLSRCAPMGLGLGFRGLRV